MPVYTVPPIQLGEDPVLEAAKNFMKSPAYARQFMGNIDEATNAQQPPPGMGMAGPGGHHPGDGHDHSAGMSPAALAAFDRLSGYYPDLNVTSAYRDPSHNARVGGAKGSQHIHGNAYDISTAGLSREQIGAMIDAAQMSGFNGIGVYDNSLHFDVGPERAWGPSYGRESLPAWALPYIPR
jgi:hypothetical protein